MWPLVVALGALPFVPLEETEGQNQMHALAQAKRDAEAARWLGKDTQRLLATRGVAVAEGEIREERFLDATISALTQEVEDASAGVKKVVAETRHVKSRQRRLVEPVRALVHDQVRQAKRVAAASSSELGLRGVEHEERRGLDRGMREELRLNDGVKHEQQQIESGNVKLDGSLADLSEDFDAEEVKCAHATNVTDHLVQYAESLTEHSNDHSLMLVDLLNRTETIQKSLDEAYGRLTRLMTQVDSLKLAPGVDAGWIDRAKLKAQPSDDEQESTESTGSSLLQASDAPHREELRGHAELGRKPAHARAWGAAVLGLALLA